METEVSTNGSGKGRRKARGRKDAEKQEQVLKPEALSVKADELISLYRALEDAKTEFSEAIKATAEASGFHAKNVRTFIIAKAGEKFAQRKEQAQQLSLIFEEVPA